MMSDWIYRASKGWVVIFFLVVMALFMAFVLPNQAQEFLQTTGSSQSPDTSFFYTPDSLFQLAESYGPDGRQYYISNRWTFDLIFPLVYVGFLASGISWFLRGSTSKRWRKLNLIPIFSGLFDYLENLAASIVMAYYPTRLNPPAYLSTVFTLIKWVFVYSSFVIYLLGLVYYLVSVFKSKE
jgi:hypothetical protein